MSTAHVTTARLALEADGISVALAVSIDHRADGLDAEGESSPGAIAPDQHAAAQLALGAVGAASAALHEAFALTQTIVLTSRATLQQQLLDGERQRSAQSSGLGGMQ